MNEVKLFENEEIGIFVRTILNDDGSISVNAEDVAVGLGWGRTQMKNGKQYNSIRWETLNGYCEEFGFTNKLGKDDYIPESVFYMLAMKASNDRAARFQRWLAMKVVPSIRKNGGYISGQETLSDDELMEKALLVAQRKIADRDKKIAEQSAEIEIMKPKAEMCDKLLDASMLVNFRDAAKEIGISQSQFTGWLKENGYVYANSAGELRPMEQYMKSEFFQMKPYQNPYNGYKSSRTYITGRGLAAFKKLIDTEGHNRDTMKKHGGRKRR